MGEREKPKRPNVINTFYFLICQFTFPFFCSIPLSLRNHSYPGHKTKNAGYGEVRFFIMFYISFVVRIFSFSMYFCISFDHCFHITWLIISIFYRTVWILGPWFETYSKEKGSWPAEGIVVDTSAFAPLAVHPGLAVVGSSHSPAAAGVLPLDSRHLSAPYCARAFSQCQGTFWAGL